MKNAILSFHKAALASLAFIFILCSVLLLGQGTARAAVSSIASTAPQVTSVVVDGSLEEAGTTVRFYFNESMYPDGISWADPEKDGTYNPDYLFYAYNPTTWTYRTWGTGATAVFDTETNDNDKVTVTLGESPTIASGDTIWVSVPDTEWWYPSSSVTLDTTGPSVRGAYLTTDIGSDGAATQEGDVITIIFSEPVEQNSLEGNLIFSGPEFNNVPLLALSSNNTILIITLTGNETDFVGRTVSLGSGLTDVNGNNAADNPDPLPVIETVSVAPATGVVLSDSDTTGWGISNADITITWTAPFEGDHINLYILPSGTALDTSAHYKINSSPIPLSTTSFNGSDSTLYIYGDSRSNFSTYSYFSFDSSEYIAYVVTCDAAESVCLQAASLPFPFSNEMSGYNYSTYVSQTTPWGWSTIPISQKVFSMRFSGAMDESTINSSNITLAVQDGNPISGTVTYDSTFNTVNFTVPAETTLPSNSTLIFSSTSDVKDSFNASVAYTTYFYTNSDSDTAAPSVSWSYPYDDSTDTDPLLASITVGFSEALDPTTITASSFSSSPDVSATMQYDPSGYSASLQFSNSSLLPDTDYTIRFYGSVIKDASGNAMGDDFLLNFHTAELDTTAPRATWSTFTPSGFEVGFDKPMKNAALTNSANYTLTCEGAPVSLSAAWFYWDSYSQKLSVTGAPLTEGDDCSLAIGSDITGTNNVSIDASTSTQTGTVATMASGTDYYMTLASSTSGDVSFRADECAACTGLWDNAGVQYWNPINVWSEGKIAGMATTLHFNFPITQPISDNGTVNIIFPAGFDISSATLNDSYGNPFWGNRDINSWADQTVAISSLSTNLATRTVSLTLDIDGDGTIGENGDQLYITIGGITNSDTPSTNYVLQFETKNSTGETIEGPNDFNPLEVTAAGNGSVTVHVENANTQAAIPNVPLSIYSWNIGTQRATTNAEGNATFSGIPIDSWGTWVNAWMDGSHPVDGYMPNWSGAYFNLTTEDASQTQTISLTPANLRISGTITHTGIGTDGNTKVNMWASGSSWNNTTVTLDADGSTNYSIQLGTAGWYQVGLDRYWDYSSGGGYDNNASFVTPMPQNVTVEDTNTAENPATQNFTLTAASKTLVITVTDQNGAAVTNGWCSVNADYSSGFWFWSGGQTDTTGVCSISVAAGTYNVYVSMPGVYSNNNKTVIVEESDTNVPISFVLSTPDNLLSGSVLDGNGNGIQWASVNCWMTDGGYGWGYGNTDSNGSFEFLVNDGTWSCNAWAPNLGEVPAAIGVDVTNFAVTSNMSGLNFAYDPNSFATVTGTVQKADTTAVSYSWLSLERYDGETKQYIGWGNGASTDTNGAFSVQVIRNTGTERYRISMWDSTLGSFVLASNIDLSSGSLDLGTLALPALRDITFTASSVPGDTSTMWLNILNEDTGYWNWTSINLTDGSGSASFSLIDGSYSVHTWLPGLGEYTENFTVSGAGSTVAFDLSAVTVSTITVTVQDEGGDPVANAYVSAEDTTNDRFINGFTDSSGVATMTVLSDSDSTFVVNANEPSHISDSDTLSSGDTTATLTLATADQTISGTVVDGDGNPVANALVEVEDSDGSGGWTSTYTNGTGAYTLQVADGTYDISVRDANGNYGTEESVADGATAVQVAADQSLSYFVNQEPEVANVDPTTEVAVTTDLADITAPAGALGQDQNGVTLAIDDTTSSPEIDGVGAPGDIAVSIEATNSQGDSITNLNDNVTLEIHYTDEQIEALANADEIASLADMDTCLGYFDEINGSWTCLANSTASITYQDDAGDNYVTQDLTEWLAANPTGTESIFAGYNDATIDYTAQTNHFTLFAPRINNAPSQPAPTPVQSSSRHSSSASEGEVSGGGGGGGAPAPAPTAKTPATTAKAAEPSTAPSPTVETPKEEPKRIALMEQAPKEVVVNPKSDYKNHWAKTYVQTLFDRGIVSGCGKNKFCPNDTITRAEMLKIAMNLFNISADAGASPFSDVRDHWSKSYVSGAYKAGIVEGYADGTFKPDQIVNRAEALKMLFAAAGIKPVGNNKAAMPFSDVSRKAWYFKYVTHAYQAGIVMGYTDGNRKLFKPEQSVTRAEFVKMALEVEKIKKSK